MGMFVEPGICAMLSSWGSRMSMRRKSGALFVCLSFDSTTLISRVWLKG